MPLARRDGPGFTPPLRFSAALRLRAGRCASISRAEWRARRVVYGRVRPRICREKFCAVISSARCLWGDLRDYFWKWARNNSRTFFDGNDFIDGHVCQFFHQATGPGDFQRVDFCTLAEAEENARIVCGHVAHAALGLLDVGDSFGG